MTNKTNPRDRQHDSGDAASDGEQQQQQQPRAKRMEYFLKLIDKALLEAGHAIDPEKAVAECYGDDASIFAGDTTTSSSSSQTKDRRSSPAAGNENDEDKKKRDTENGKNVLVDIVKGTIERVTDSIKSGILEVLEKEDVNAKMLKLEHVVQDFERRERAKRDRNEDEKRVADEWRETVVGDSSKRLRGTDGGPVPPIDVLNYRTFRLKMEEKDRLLAEIASMEAENEVLERRMAVTRGEVTRRMDEVGGLAEDLSRATEAYVFSGVS
mmetsp:Transcript_29833/g.36328  ORF Transcript_29833/g.36328 Transcript_29833/m.36328 type:complete len:268 (+) Transcript_29833:86-889(+)|eukprot:CAMPEP_0172508208 /NCGR_PEP_ID=MMETSP1066-20121228/210203_1 /TAXON_ID=671091 /ORGANISM="Coscinodiscus wailesii, Strain CCMP2513" /LENGTH=267 /DNA_ID=CAMNT_0013286091 /DNA_START=79 /DNA_END=882 /DNA_ORIENTATION=+